MHSLTPDEEQGILRRLDAQMALWDSKDIRVGYLLTSDPDDADLDAPSGIPDAAVEAVFLNLAIKLAPGYGKTLSPDTRISAKAAYDALLTNAAQPLQSVRAPMLAGAGNKSRMPFLPTPAEPILAGTDGAIDDFT